EQMVSLGLLAREVGLESFYSPVIIYPTQSLYFVSDRWSNPDGSDFTLPDDFVYPPNTPNTHRFLRILSHDPCECLLDLGTGTRKKCNRLPPERTGDSRVTCGREENFTASPWVQTGNCLMNSASDNGSVRMLPISTSCSSCRLR